MATMYPESPVDFNGSCGERDVFDALKTLDDPCFVFHSLPWLNTLGPHRYEASLPLQGEADFVIIDPRRGILVIEVKSGGIRHENRQWYQTNTATQEERPIQDPFQQANRSAHFLRKRIAAEVPAGGNIGVYHAVWFPSVSFDPQRHQLDCAPAMVFDLESLAAPGRAIQGAFDFWHAHRPSGQLSAHQTDAVLRLLAPAFRVMPSFRASLEARERQFVRMTSEQARLFEYLDDQSHALIGGPAGSGKTVLAVELARRIAETGEQVVFLCFNSALRKHLELAQSCDRIAFCTFHSYAGAYVQDHGLSYAETEARFLAALADDSAGIVIPNLIIDEGQDFSDDWIEYLRLRTRSRFFVFFDRNQLLFRKTLPSWFAEAECRLTLKRICRNTRQIAATVTRSIGAHAPEVDTPAGLKPQLYIVDDLPEAREIAAGIVSTHVSQNGLAPSDIAVLTMEGTSGSEVAGCAWPVPVSSEFGQQALCLTTVRKFKGLESRVVIITDVALERLTEEEYRRLFYVACSRAIHELHIIARGCPAESLRGAVAALAPGSRLAANPRTIAFLLAAELNRKLQRTAHV